MRPMTIGEIEHLVDSLQPLVGARLQKVYSSDHELVMEFYGAQGEFWLWWDLQTASPLVVLLHEKPPSFPKQIKPLVLFLRAHAVNRRLASAVRPQGGGRLLRLTLGSSDSNEGLCQIEGRLFPHGQNLGVQVGDKGMWWKKPQELPPLQTTEEEFAVTSPTQLWREWRELRWPSQATSNTRSKSEPQVGDLAKEIAKRERAIAKVQNELAQDRGHRWRLVGEWLKEHQSLEVPPDWQEQIDCERSFSWNLENCFAKAKQLEAKRAGTERRLQSLRAELTALQQGQLPQNSAATTGLLKESKSRSSASEVKARKHMLGGKFEAYVGKSARDNLELLRRARAWDLWLHLRDYPGSHCIIRRNKNETVPDHLLLEAAHWMASATFGRKAEQRYGEKLVVLCAECRFVRPIRGDRVGRVTYQNESTLTFTFSKGP